MKTAFEDAFVNQLKRAVILASTYIPHWRQSDAFKALVEHIRQFLEEEG